MTSNSTPDRPTIRLGSVCLDCFDADEMAAFYGRLLGWEVVARDTSVTRQGGTGWVLLGNPAGGVRLSFQAEDWYQSAVWPEEPSAPTKMLHLDIMIDDIESAVAHAVAAGARVAAHQPPDRSPDQLRVMLDPAGHPFCLCTDEAAARPEFA